MVNTFFLSDAIRINVESYVWKHYPFSEYSLVQERTYTFTPTTRVPRGSHGEGIWFVRVELPRLQTAYGLFVCVWEDGEVGGVLEDDGQQKMFEFVPSESSPVVKNWPTKPLEAEEEDLR